MNHFQSYSNLVSQVDHLWHLHKTSALRLPQFLMGPVSLKQIGSMFFDMNVSNTKSKNLVLVSPLKQNLNKIRNWLGAPKLIMVPLIYARHN